MAYVYEHRRLDTGNIFYVGISLSDDPKYKRAYNKTYRNKVWKRIISKTEYEVIIIADNLTTDEAKVMEKEKIAEYGRINLGSGLLCNMTQGGDGICGYKFSDEHRRRQSERMMGEKNPWFGKCGEDCNSFGRKHTDESKRKMSEANKGRVHSEESKKRMSEKMKGRKCSEEVRAGRRERMIGDKNPMFGKAISEEHREKLRIASSGKKHTEEAKRKMGEKRKGELNPMYGKRGELAPNFGRKRSEETLRKASESRKGKYTGENNPCSKLVLDVETGIFYVSATEAYNCLSPKVSIGYFMAMLKGTYPNKTTCNYV